MQTRLLLIVCLISLIGIEGASARRQEHGTSTIAVGSNGNGQSWATAWNKLSNINYASISAGDTVYVSGGSVSQAYSERWIISKGGNSATNRITYRNGVDAGHNGTVIIDGGGS